MFNYALNTSYSDAACSVEVNPFRGTATVWFWTGGEYKFAGVSRRVIAKTIVEDFVMGGIPSVGQWVNKNLLAA